MRFTEFVSQSEFVPLVPFVFLGGFVFPTADVPIYHWPTSEEKAKKRCWIESLVILFDYYQIVGNQQMYEVLDDTVAQVILATESGDSIRHVAQHLRTTLRNGQTGGE